MALLVAACGAPAPASPVAQATAPAAAAPADATPTLFAAAYLTTAHADAASLRNQLAFGTLRLAGTAEAVGPEQAQALLPLWQAIVALSGSATTAEAELTAVQNQIVEAMAPAQLQAIAALQITNADLSAFYAEKGIVLPTPQPGVTKQPGGGNSGLAQADREATRTAAQALGTPVGTGSGQAAKTVLFEAVIEMLTAQSAQ